MARELELETWCYTPQLGAHSKIYCMSPKIISVNILGDVKRKLYHDGGSQLEKPE